MMKQNNIAENQVITNIQLKNFIIRIKQDPIFCKLGLVLKSKTYFEFLRRLGLLEMNNLIVSSSSSFHNSFGHSRVGVNRFN